MLGNRADLLLNMQRRSLLDVLSGTVYYYRKRVFDTENMRYAYIARDVKEQVNRETGRFFDTQSPSSIRNLQKGIQFNEELLNLSSSLDEIIRNYENRLHKEIDTVATTMATSQDALNVMAEVHFQTSWHSLMPSEKLSLLKRIRPPLRKDRQT